MFLPGACRKWKRQAELWLPNPNWINADYQVNFVIGDMNFVAQYMMPVIYRRSDKIYDPAA